MTGEATALVHLNVETGQRCYRRFPPRGLGDTDDETDRGIGRGRCGRGAGVTMCGLDLEIAMVTGSGRRGCPDARLRALQTCTLAMSMLWCAFSRRGCSEHVFSRTAPARAGPRPGPAPAHSPPVGSIASVQGGVPGRSLTPPHGRRPYQVGYKGLWGVSDPEWVKLARDLGNTGQCAPVGSLHGRFDSGGWLVL